MTKERGLYLSVVVVLGALVLLAGKPKADNDGNRGKEDRLADQVAKLQKRCDELEKRAENSQQQISWLSRTSPPVGTVMSFAGEWPPRKGEGGKWSEEELGWMLCDGRKVEGTTYAELRAVLGKDAVPDYRGYFLRGVDASIDGKTTSGRDKEGIRAPGKEQGFATARPTKENAFTTNEESEKTISADRRYFVRNANEDGAHQVHNATTKGSGFNGWVDVTSIYPATMKVPKHSHSITGGGDLETRPVNVAVYWIIKLK